MKNKTKRNKIYSKNGKKPEAPANWFYMNDKEVTVRDIFQALESEDSIHAEIWETAGVLELEIPDQKSIDFEQTKPDLRDEYSNAILKEHQIKSLFYVTIDPENIQLIQCLMKKIVFSCGGFFCGDTEDFSPNSFSFK